MSGEYGGWERISKPQSVAATIATWDVRWRIVVQEQNALSQFAPSYTRDYLTQASQFVYIVNTVYDTTLLKIVNHDYPLTIPKH
jgi:hypothetical protein